MRKHSSAKHFQSSCCPFPSPAPSFICLLIVGKEIKRNSGHFLSAHLKCCPTILEPTENSSCCSVISDFLWPSGGHGCFPKTVCFFEFGKFMLIPTISGLVLASLPLYFSKHLFQWLFPSYCASFKLQLYYYYSWWMVWFYFISFWMICSFCRLRYSQSQFRETNFSFFCLSNSPVFTILCYQCKNQSLNNTYVYIIIE